MHFVLAYAPRYVLLHCHVHLHLVPCLPFSPPPCAAAAAARMQDKWRNIIIARDRMGE